MDGDTKGSASTSVSPPSSSSNSKNTEPIKIQRPSDLPDLDLAVGDLSMNEQRKSKRRKRKNRKIQTALSVCSSLPNINQFRDVNGARAAYATPSQTDARPMRNTLRRQSAVEPPREPSWALDAKSPVADIYAEEYNMNHPRRGVSLILNHVNFEDEETREGSDKDCARLSAVYRKLGFDVRIENDLNLTEVITTLRKLSQEDHSQNDCLMVTVLTHGSRGELFARDHTYDADKLWIYFTADKCPTLAGKPKMFIIQACRGQNLDPGTVMAIRKTSGNLGTDGVDASGGAVRYAIPNNADILIANATIEGYYAWRNPSKGSWFIQVLCDLLELHHDRRDMHSILTFVACRVAVDHESDVPGSYMNKMKQIPCILSMLTRLVYFRRKDRLKK